MSSEECRVCKLIGNNYEGCDVTTTTPVCDGDKDDTTAVTKTYESDKTAKCVGCKKDGESSGGVAQYLYK